MKLQRDTLLQWVHAQHGRRDPELASSVSASIRALPTLSESIDEDNFVSTVERCYKEQRLLTASVDSFSRTHSLLRSMIILLWFAVFVCAAFFVWGFDLATWAIPSASALLSLVVLLGRVPSDFAASTWYAVVVRPYDIGDRVTLSTPGSDSQIYSLIVKHIDLMRTYFITSHGETMILENHVIRTLSVINLNRSGSTTLVALIQVPTATPSAKITELVDSIRSYVAEKDAEWSDAMFLFSTIDFERGHIELKIWATSVFPSHEVSSIYSAKSRLLLFIHAYMQSADIEYVKPIVPILHTKRDSDSECLRI